MRIKTWKTLKYLGIILLSLVFIFEFFDFNDMDEIIFTASVFDLQKHPPEEYEMIRCRKSKPIIVSTTLCVNNFNKDKNISSSIMKDGIWDEDTVHQIVYYLFKNPDTMLIDIGAYIGQASLFAAHIGHHVIAVEPFYENVIRIHKAAFNESIGKRITLITSAISNKRGEIKLLEPNENNIAEQGLVENRHSVVDVNSIKIEDPISKYYVETILLDDLVAYIPLKDDNYKYDKAVLKISIVGYEPLAFRFATKLFKKLEIPLIFMQWGYSEHHGLDADYENMLGFLYSRNYIAYSKDEPLDRKNWKTAWPTNIVWHKKNKLNK